VGQAEAGRAELVERDAADLAREPHRAADLGAHPGHAGLVGPHVGAEDVILDVAKGAGQRAHQALLALDGHAGIALEHGLPAAVGKARGGVLERHRASEAKALLRRDVRRHAEPADRGTRGRVVDDQRPAQPHPRLVDVDDLRRTQLVRESERVFHRTPTS
jgi:hypothetical protein